MARWLRGMARRPENWRCAGRGLRAATTMRQTRPNVGVRMDGFAPATSRRLMPKDTSGWWIGGAFEADSLRPVTCVDANIFRGEVAGPITRRRPACMQIHQNVHMLFQ